METEVMSRPLDTAHCSFCDKSQHDVVAIVAGPNNIFICDECALLVWEIVDPKKRAHEAAEAEYKSWGAA